MFIRTKTDLIIMGTKDEAHKSWWEGSVAAEVLGNPSAPVLIIPEKSDYSPIERISFATDLHRGDLLNVLDLLNLLKPIKPEIRCIHVAEEEERTEIQLDELIQAFSHQIKGVNIHFHQLEEEDTTEALEAFNLIYHIDLQVLIKPRRNILAALFHKSQSQKTARFTHIPLLVIPA